MFLVKIRANRKLKKLNTLMAKNGVPPYSSVDDFIEYNYGILHHYDQSTLKCLDAYIALEEGK